MKPNFKDINIKASEKASMSAAEWEKANEVDFPRNRRDLSFGIFLIAIDDADVNGAFTDHVPLRTGYGTIFPA